MTTTHTQHGKATGVGFTVQVTPITTEQFEDIRQHVNDYHGGLAISRLQKYPAEAEVHHQHEWVVQILADDGSVDRHAVATFRNVQAELYKRAFENGWNDADQGVLTIDLGQFDPWSLGYCVQMAAFGEEIVS